MEDVVFGAGGGWVNWLTQSLVLCNSKSIHTFTGYLVLTRCL